MSLESSFEMIDRRTFADVIFWQLLWSELSACENQLHYALCVLSVNSFVNIIKD